MAISCRIVLYTPPSPPPLLLLLLPLPPSSPPPLFPTHSPHHPQSRTPQLEASKGTSIGLGTHRRELLAPFLLDLRLACTPFFARDRLHYGRDMVAAAPPCALVCFFGRRGGGVSLREDCWMGWGEGGGRDVRQVVQVDGLHIVAFVAVFVCLGFSVIWEEISMLMVLDI